MPDSKTKRFTFWRARFSPEPYDRSLQRLLRARFDNTKIRDRLLSIDEEDLYFRFINYKTEIRGYFCANFFGYERGRIGQVIREQFDEDQIDPSALPPPQAADGTAQQFLDGKLYFICLGDNLVLAQDMHLKAKHLERYLNTLLRTSRALYLEPSISLRAHDEITGVKNITLSAPLRYRLASDDTIALLPEDRLLVRQSEDLPLPAELHRAPVQQNHLIPLGQSWEAIKTFLGDSFDFTQFETRGFIEAKEIEVSLHLAWKGRKQERVSDQLDTLANTFRHVENEDMDIELDTLSGKVKQNELRLSKQQSVQHRQDFPVAEDLFEKMIEWYEYLVEEGDI